MKNKRSDSETMKDFAIVFFTIIMFGIAICFCLNDYK